MSSQKTRGLGQLFLIVSVLVGITIVMLGIVTIVLQTRANNNEVINLGEVGRFEERTDYRIIDPPQQVSDFTLTAHDDLPVSLGDFRGQLVMLYFGYTNCPDACPATLLDFKRIKNALGEEASNIQFMMISVDPERDNPDALNNYVKGYDPEFVGLTGSHDVLRSITDNFGVVYTQNENTTSQAGYLVDHTVSKFLVDQQGRLVRVYAFMTDPSTIVEDILSLLN